MKDTITIPAMMDDDLFAWMKKNGYYEPMKRGEIKCPCGEVITEENLDALMKKDGKMIFYHSVICATQDEKN